MIERGIIPGPRLTEDIKPRRKEEQPTNPVISFFQELLQRLENRLQDQPELEESCDDDEFLNITFTSIDDVIEFYRSEEEEDSECDPERKEEFERLRGGDGFRKRVDVGFDIDAHADDTIVSSWIDNYHFLLVEQEKRKQKQKQKQKRVRFETTNSTDGSDDSFSDFVLVIANEGGDDECSLASSCCSSSTDSTWRSLDTTEEQEFEEFANQWRMDRGIHGKNTEKSLFGWFLREVLVGSLDEDFEAFDDEECDTYDGHGSSSTDQQKELQGSEKTTRNKFQSDFGAVSVEFPSDLLFSIE